VTPDANEAEDLSGRIAEDIKSSRVSGIPVFWDVLSWAFMKYTENSRQSLNQLYDRYGNQIYGGKH